MTCIVGIKYNNRIYIGGDSAGIDEDYGIVTRCDEKVFSNGPLIMGFSGSFRMGQLLRYALQIPPHEPKEKDDMEYLVVDLIDEIRYMFREKGYLAKDDGREEGGDFILGYKGKLYLIYSDFQVGKIADDYIALGCGENFALGSLHSTINLNFDPKKRITMALQAASHHNAGVKAPYTILNL